MKKTICLSLLTFSSLFADTNLDALKSALNILVTSMMDRGFMIESVRIIYDDGNEIVTPDLSERSIKVDLNYVNKMLGIKIDNEKFIQFIKRMGFNLDNSVLIPPYRTDIMHPIDIVEDVAIAYGYENFIPELPNIFTIGRSLDKKEFEQIKLHSEIGAEILSKSHARVMKYAKSIATVSVML